MEIQVVDVGDEDEEEEWEDLDSNKERAAEIERRKRILKGQIARAAARERELVPLEDCMPRNEPSVDPVGTQRQARRMSLGHATKTPSGKQSQAPIGLKRKINAEEAPQKGRRMSSGSQGALASAAAAAAALEVIGQEGEGNPSQDKLLREMQVMMLGLTANVKDVRGDIEEVRKDLGEQISQGRRETESLKKRMDEHDQGFDDRVALSLIHI